MDDKDIKHWVAQPAAIAVSVWAA
ncbi:hypothetical protein OSCI_4030012 [Kamptonema sp. PCC 6506]|nr:hypothetical protein OSCI_4030012 [Kamptonema sp. PCC 6506]